LRAAHEDLDTLHVEKVWSGPVMMVVVVMKVYTKKQNANIPINVEARVTHAPDTRISILSAHELRT